MCLVKVSYGKFPYISFFWSKLTHLENIFFLLCFFGPLDWVGFWTKGEEQVGLKSCQSCVSALRHSQNVFVLFFFLLWGGWGGTGRHDCRSILLPCLPVLAILNKNEKLNETLVVFRHSGGGEDADQSTAWGTWLLWGSSPQCDGATYWMTVKLQPQQRPSKIPPFPIARSDPHL